MIALFQTKRVLWIWLIALFFIIFNILIESKFSFFFSSKCYKLKILFHRNITQLTTLFIYMFVGFSSLNFVSIVIRYSFMSTLKCQLCVSKIYTEIFTRVFEYSVEHSIVKRQITKRWLYKIPLRVCGHNYKGLLTRKSCFRF